MDFGNFYDISREHSYSTPFQYSPMLPLILLSLASQKNSPSTTTRIHKEYDYIIVGAGSAGSVVASRLSEESCANFLLLEAGKTPPLLSDIPGLRPYFINSDIDWQFMTEPQTHTARLMRNRSIPWHAGKVVGGSSSINHMVYIRGRPETYNMWEAHGAKGWGWKDMFRYFLKDEDNQDLKFVKTGYHNTSGPMTVDRFRYGFKIRDRILEAHEDLGYRFVDPNGKVMIGAADYQANLRNGQRCSAAKAYLVPAENRTNLDIVAQAFVTKILIDHKTAYGVQFDYKGASYRVKAKKEVIVSAGTFNSAKLLLLSGIGPRRTLKDLGIPLVADLPVGKNLQEHGGVSAFFTTNIPLTPTSEQLQDPENVLQYLTERSGILSTVGIIHLSFLKDNPEKRPVAVPDYEIGLRYFEPKNEAKGFNIPDWVYKSFFAPNENTTNIVCNVNPLQPRSRGYVTIKSTDPYKMPVIQPNYLEDPEDVRIAVSGLKACRKILRSPRLAKFGIRPYDTLLPGCEKYARKEDQYLECFVKSLFFSSLHQTGTAKMGDPRDSTCVTDTQLKVKGVKGLRVVDASVMPIIPSGNTNNPVMALAEKASDLIKKNMCKR